MSSVLKGSHALGVTRWLYLAIGFTGEVGTASVRELGTCCSDTFSRPLLVGADPEPRVREGAGERTGTGTEEGAAVGFELVADLEAPGEDLGRSAGTLAGELRLGGEIGRSARLAPGLGGRWIGRIGGRGAGLVRDVKGR